MGCTPSSVENQFEPEAKLDASNKALPKIDQNSKKVKQKKDKNANDRLISSEVPKPVAFDVGLNDGDSIIRRLPPKRLNHLAPIENGPKLTADMLLEKQILAEVKRHKELDKVRELSRRSSRRKSEIEEARKFSLTRQKTDLMLNQETADMKREAKLNEIREKQKIREERAQRAREKAKRINEMADVEADIEVEKDNQFNKDDDVDSWLMDDDYDDDDDFTDAQSYNNNRGQIKVKSVDSGCYGVRGRSAGSTNSHEYALPKKLPPIGGVDHSADVRYVDDFFDS